MTNNNKEINWKDLEGLKLYQDMVRKHGEKNAKQKMEWIQTIPYSNLELFEVIKGEDHCECGKKIRNCYIVPDKYGTPHILGSTCFYYLCQYLEVDTSAIKEAEKLFKNKLLAKEIRGKKYTVKELKEILKEKRKDFRNRMTKAEELWEEAKNHLRKIVKGEMVFEDAFPQMSKPETSFFKNYVTNKSFTYFVRNISWLGQQSYHHGSFAIVDQWLKKAVAGVLSVKQKEHLQIVMDDFIFSYDGDSSYLDEQQEFFKEITQNPKFLKYLEDNQETFWIGKYQHPEDGGFIGMSLNNNTVVAKWIRSILKGRPDKRKLSEKQFKWCKEALKAFKGKTDASPELAQDRKMALFLEEHLDKIYNYGGSFFNTTDFVESIVKRTKNGLTLTDYEKDGKRKGQRKQAEKLIKYLGKNYQLYLS